MDTSVGKILDDTEDQSAVSDATEQTEPNVGTEQTQTERKPVDYADELLRLAAEDGLAIGDAPPKEEPEADPEETKVESETTAEVSMPADTDKTDETEEESEEAKEEEKPAEKKGDIWPDSAKQRVAEETAKRKRANERAEKAEALAAQYQAQLAQTVAPRPTEDNPFADVQDVTALDRLESSFEKTIDLADENPDGAVDVVVGRDKDGKEIRRDFTPEELVVLRKKADKAIRKFIPEHRTYLQQRAVADAEALTKYPELKDPDSEFTKAAAYLAQQLLTGKAQKEPDVLVWIARAVRGYQAEQQSNGNEAAKVKSPEAKRIVESAKQRVAPTPTRTRSFTERGTSSAKNLEKAAQRLEQTGSPEDAEALVGALFARRESGAKRVEQISE